MEKTEKEIVKLKNEKLESEISHKNTELASAAMHLVQKGELLGKIKDEILRLKKQAGFENGSGDLKKIIRVLSEEDKVDKQWEQFTVHFDNFHDGFLSGLKAKYPALTPHELKLSAYLRMNLSSKEIAQLLNISVRGAELNRYRLRKKLQIPAEMTLYDFLTNETGSG
jgi:DNA-binding CsgD family transcriptional regulator